MNPYTGPHTSIKSAASLGTLRAAVSRSPASIEADGREVSIDECWLEQRAKMDFLYSPLRNTDVVFLCMTSPVLLVDPWPYEYGASPSNVCFRAGDGDHFTYVFSFSLKAIPKDHFVVAFGGDCDAPNYSEPPPPMVTLSWAPLNVRASLLTWLYRCMYWPFAMITYFFVILPIFIFCLLIPGYPVNPNELLVGILRWLFKISPDAKKWRSSAEKTT